MSKFLKFSEIRKMYSEMPPKKMLWSGIKEKTFGLVFGPSKSGKTIFCENLAISIATGKKSFFNYPLDGIPKKVLFIGLEETWDNRAERNLKQFDTLSDEETVLMDENFIVQNLEFSKTIIKEEDWNNLRELIKEVSPDVVFIDSITRMSPGKIENSDVAEKIMLDLRNISQEFGITLFAIHHTPKLHGNPITMDSIKGSAVFAQESDFAIGINRTDYKNRYMKNVFFRYERDDDDKVIGFNISENSWLDIEGEIDEDTILKKTDRRIAYDKRDVICDFFNSNPNTTYTSKEAVNILMECTGLKDRQIKTHLSRLSAENKINGSKRGFYVAMNNSLNVKKDE